MDPLIEDQFPYFKTVMIFQPAMLVYQRVIFVDP